MSPVRKPSAIALRTATARPGAALDAKRPKQTTRITVDLPPGMYQDLTAWTLEVAQAAGLPRLSLNKAIRAVIDEMTSDSASVGRIAARLHT